MTEILGYISIILTILIWWTWLIISRKSAAKINNPYIENLLITIGAFIFNLLLFFAYIIWNGWIAFEFSYFLYPFLSWILWAFAWLFAMIACAKIGVWKAMAIWAPAGMVVSFLWWILYYNEFSSSLLYAILAVLIIIAGVSLVINARNKADDNKVIISWVLFAVAASLIWWGTYLIPIKELASEISVFITLLPLSVGMLFGAMGIYLSKTKRKNWNKVCVKTWFPIIVSWVMWALWNLFATIAVLTIGIWKAYPLAELCGVVNALFAVFFLKEIIDSSKIKIFLLWVIISFGWAIWLSILKI